MSASLRIVCTAVCITVIAAATAQGDETSTAVAKAERLYRQGKLGQAFDQLETARTLIARRLSTRYAKSFPPAPSGWRAEAVQFSTKGPHRVGRGLVLRRHYRQVGGPGVATAKINIDQLGVIEAAQAWSPNEQHALAVKRKLVPIKGAANAFLKFSEGRRTGNLYMFLAGRFYFTVSGRKVANSTFLTSLLSTWDFEGLKRTSGMN